MSRSHNPQVNHSFVDPVSHLAHFSWKHTTGGSSFSREVFCEGVRLTAAAKEFGTPLYLYSSAAIEDAFRGLSSGLGLLPHTLCFAVKANGNFSILKHLATMGSSFDIVSGGEMAQLREIGISGKCIVFSGVGKTREEIRNALRYRVRRTSRSGILLFNIESDSELDVLLEESARHVSRGGIVPHVAIRVNPDVQAGGHPHISTGHHQHKFGLGWKEARALYLKHRDSKWISWQGISAHIGSQIVDLEPFQRALLRLADYLEDLRREGIVLSYLDFGGGLGVRYAGKEPASPLAYARMVSKIVKPLGVHLLLEPGRSLIAAAGVLLTRVIRTKKNGGKTFVVVDAAMNDLLRPALYNAIHPITRVRRESVEDVAAPSRVDIVGPVCESGDSFLRDWPLGAVESGDLLAIWVAGAYGMSLASNYNARCRPAEVLVEGHRCRLIRRRESLADLLRTNARI